MMEALILVWALVAVALLWLNRPRWSDVDTAALTLHLRRKGWRGSREVPPPYTPKRTR